MQTAIERRSGDDRRNLSLPSINVRRQQERRGSTTGLAACSGEQAYAVVDPYWEPVCGQDDQ